MSQHDTLTLEPCPFCGGQPELEDCRTIWVVRCKCEACVLGKRAPEPDGSETDEYWQGIRQTAIDAWNRRAALSATQPAQAKQPEPAEHWHRLYLEKCQQYNDRVAQLGGVIEALDAEAAQGEPFGFVHHYVAHDSQGRIIDSTWEADGCEDEMPHPTHPIKWMWERSEPFYTKTAVAQGAGEVVPYAYAVYFPDQPTEMLVHDLDDLCEDMTNREHTVTQLYTQPAAGADVLKNAARYEWLRSQDNEDFAFAVVKNPHFDVYESPEELDSAIDAAIAASGRHE